MTTPRHFPNLQAPLISGDKISPAWSKFLRELFIDAKAELAPGRVCPFWLSAAQLADPGNFVQSGATAGLGVGDYLGWALCNGNNDTPSGVNDTFLRWSTAGSGSAGGTDDLPPHIHTISHDHPTFNTGVGVVASSSYTGIEHVDGTLDYARIHATVDDMWFDFINVPADSWTSDCKARVVVDVPALTGESGTGYGVSGPTSTADNRPAFKTMVPLMRVP